MSRDRYPIARCTIERLMREMGLRAFLDMAVTNLRANRLLN